MKKVISMNLIICLSVVIVFIGNANAALVNNADGTITDTDTNLMWLRDFFKEFFK